MQQLLLAQWLSEVAQVTGTGLESWFSDFMMAQFNVMLHNSQEVSLAAIASTPSLWHTRSLRGLSRASATVLEDLSECYLGNCLRRHC